MRVSQGLGSQHGHFSRETALCSFQSLSRTLILFKMKALLVCLLCLLSTLASHFPDSPEPQAPINLCWAPPCVNPQRCKSELDSTLALRQDVLSKAGRQRTFSYNERCHSVTCSKLGASHGRIGVWKEGPQGECYEGSNIIRVSLAGSAGQAQETGQELGRPTAEGRCTCTVMADVY